MNELIIKENNLNVNNNILRIVEYKGEKVISSYDISRLHNKEVKRVNEQFERNKDRLQEGMDYFLVSVEEFAVVDRDHKISSKSRHKFERNKERLKEGIDYFLISVEEFSKSLSATQNFIPNNVKDIKRYRLARQDVI